MCEVTRRCIKTWGQTWLLLTRLEVGDGVVMEQQVQDLWRHGPWQTSCFMPPFPPEKPTSSPKPTHTHMGQHFIAVKTDFLKTCKQGLSAFRGEDK